MLRNAGWVLPGLFFAVGLLIDKTISVTFFAAGALGIYVTWRYGLLSSMNREDRWFAAAFVVFGIVSGVAALAAGQVYPRTFPELEACARYLFAVPVFLLIRWARPPAGVVFGAVMFGAIAAGLYGLYQMMGGEQGQEGFVYGGVRHHIRFGVGAVTLAFVGLTGFDWFYRRGFLPALLPVLAVFLGLAAAIASGSRTSWLAIPVLLGIALLVSGHAVPARVRLGVAGAVLLAAVVVWVVPQTGVSDRVAVGMENIQQYHDERGHISSVGARLEMWKAAGIIFRENPVLGVGVSGYSSAVAALVDEGVIRPRTERYLDPHNEYLAVASSRGVLGLLALAMLLGVPGLLFFRASRSSDPEVRAFATAGLMVVVGFAIYGLTHTLSVRTFYITYYTMLVAFFYGMVRSRTGDAFPK